MTVAVSTSARALLASCEISRLAAGNKKSYTTGETLLLMAVIKVYEVMCGENYGQWLKAILIAVIRHQENTAKLEKM
jgi:hypothetical protein